SFAAVEETWKPCIHVFETDRNRALSLLSPLKFEEGPAELKPFPGTEQFRRLLFFRYGDRARAAALLEGAGIQSPDADTKPADLFLAEKHIRGPVIIRGQAAPGRRVDTVIRGPQFSAPEGDGGNSPPGIPLRVLSIDIETDVKSGAIRAVGLAWTDGLDGGGTGAEMKAAADGAVHAAPAERAGPAMDSLVRVLAPPEDAGGAARASAVQTAAAPGVPRFFLHAGEKSLLAAFTGDLLRIDPDVLTGWNFLDFDFPRLAGRCEYFRLPFAIGRSLDPAKFFPRRENPGGGWRGRGSAAAIVPGRQVLDALRIVRAGTWGGAGNLRGSWNDDAAADFTLDTVARTVLGEGKLVRSSGPEKIAELDRLYVGNLALFGGYCRRDAELVLRILAKTGLFRLTRERASLTGVSLDKAWTSVASFERIYGMELRRKGRAPPPFVKREVSGAAGGTILEPEPGLFSNVAVFDFRSLYPTIMRTFNIDPLSHARADAEKRGGAAAAKDTAPPDIIAPNGAAFSREPGLLPALVAAYFAARRAALDAGDTIAAQVYKILMNSFYGVLGTGACRYGRTELAGSITSFARKWLLFSRDWFVQKGFPVLYGDTDSLFVETGFGDRAGYGEFTERCGFLAGELNNFIAEKIREEYKLESFLELRFEKPYRRFLIPPLRGFQEESEKRGRAKGYGAYVINPPGEDGVSAMSVEVKGMEAVRSDSTPLARRLQLELLELVFSGGGEEDLRGRVAEILKELREGKLDGELAYRKRLSRPPETYTSSTPPQVKAARALGWKGRRGTVEYVWTVNGAEPSVDESRRPFPCAPLDYDHYASSQVFPVARSIALAAHWDADSFTPRRCSAGDSGG
ncbi:MAG: DNA polymerase II, partial [Treponema sp.]|nr:DNA polymerase II [Treponema sp.]